MNPTINCDVLVVGGGIHGCAIARDAAGRGLSVVLCERGDLAAQVSPNRFSEALRAKAAELAIPFDEGDSRTWTTRSSHRNESKSLMFNRAPTPPDMLQIGVYDVLVSSPWEE